MKKKKTKWCETLKMWWFLIPVAGFVLAFSSNILAMWNAPNQISETEKSVQELSAQLKTYTASEEEADKQRDKLISLMAAKLMEGK